MSRSSSSTGSSPSPTARYHSRGTTSSSLVVHVGSRASNLAMIQSNSVVDKLNVFFPEIRMPIRKITTTGDKILGVPLSKIGEKSLFTKELEVALEEKSVDFVVHSLKDLPTTLPPGMCIGAILKRDSPFDACVMSKSSLSRGFSRLSDLPSGSVVGTSSLRRIAQLKRLHPDLVFQDVRGNLNTRMKKLDGEWESECPDYKALILAESGMARMGKDWVPRITRSIPAEECMYAVGQGALAVECREDDLETLSMLSILHDETTVYRVVAERALLKVLEGGCSAPVAVCSDLDDNLVLNLRGGVFSLDGSEAIVTNLKVDLSAHLDVYSTPDESSADSSSQVDKLDSVDAASSKVFAAAPAAATASTSASSSSSTKRRRSMRTFSSITPGNLCMGAMEAAEKLGIDVAKRLKDLGAEPILKAAKEEVERGREESERRKAKALRKDAEVEKERTKGIEENQKLQSETS